MEKEGLVHDISVYLGRQRGGGVPDRKNELKAFSCSFCPKCWSFECSLSKKLTAPSSRECTILPALRFSSPLWVQLHTSYIFTMAIYPTLTTRLTCMHSVAMMNSSMLTPFFFLAWAVTARAEQYISYTVYTISIFLYQNCAPQTKYCLSEISALLNCEKLLNGRISGHPSLDMNWSAALSAVVCH